jgi:hypothetical protein
MSTEKEFRDELFRKIENKITATGYLVYNCGSETNLVYQIIINSNGDVQPSDPVHPSRGNYAFQTDILIKKGKIPIVAIETKYKSLTTHDILTYSTKAMKHKEIYPYLRYGLIVGNNGKIPNRFFIHNQGFDFAASLSYDKDNSFFDGELDGIINIIKRQIEDSEKLLKLIEEGNGAKRFSRNIEILL